MAKRGARSFERQFRSRAERVSGLSHLLSEHRLCAFRAVRIGEVYYNKGDYDNALKAFDAVLERFPDNPKTKSAHFMKGQTLLRTGDRNSAAKEFKYIVANYAGTEEARRATQALRGLGIAASSKPSPSRRR